MAFDEQELRQRLKATAVHVPAPRFRVDDVVVRIRRRRAKIATFALGLLLAVTAIAVAVPIGLGRRSTPQVAAPAVAPFRLSFTVTMNGTPRVLPEGQRIPKFTATPGKSLTIKVHVRVPARRRVTALWLGLSRGAVGSPDDMRPVLKHTRGALTSGLHVFRLRWTVPVGTHYGTTRILVATWETKHPSATMAQIIAELVMRR